MSETPIFNKMVNGDNETKENDSDYNAHVPEENVRIDTQEPDNDSQIFMPLVFRQILYVVALIASVAAPILAISNQELADAVITGAGILNVAAVGTALANPRRS